MSCCTAVNQYTCASTASAHCISAFRLYTRHQALPGLITGCNSKAGEYQTEQYKPADTGECADYVHG